MSNLLKGKNLYLSRLLNNLSLNELAVKIDKTKQYLSLLEKNDIKAIDDDLFNLGNSKDGEDFGEKQQINSNKKCEEDVLLKNINSIIISQDGEVNVKLK